MRCQPRPDLAWRPIVDIPPLRIALARPATGAKPAVDDFAAAVRQLSEVDE